MSELLTQRIQVAATKLKLLHLAEAGDTLITRAQEGQVGYREFLDLVMEEEVGVREGRRFKQALKLAGLPYHKTLDGFDFAFQPDLDLVRVQELKTAEHRNQLQHKLKTYLKPALLVVDEVGYLPLNRVEANYLFQLICRRYERGSVIVTSNKAFSEWAELLGNEVLAAAILDRLLHHAEVLPINGPSYRLKDRLNLARTGGMARTS